MTRVSPLIHESKTVGFRMFGTDGVDTLSTREGLAVGYVQNGKIYNLSGKPVDGSISAPEYVAKA